MIIKPTKLHDCYELTPSSFSDERGSFTKIYQDSTFAAKGLHCDFKEEYYTTSCKNVLRGLHFQLPPHDHVKCVFCICGDVFDVVLDFRAGSPTFGTWQSFLLSSSKPTGLYIGQGLAHGFLALSDNATLLYRVTSEHAPSYDSGIRWNSAGIDWPKAEYIISKRDEGLPCLSDWKSPFTWVKPA